MERSLLFLAILCAASIAHAAPKPGVLPAMSDAEVHALLAPGEAVEARIDGDLNGDGHIDTVIVAAKDDDRVVRVLFTVRDEFSIERAAAGTFHLLPAPLGLAGLSIDKGVLIVRDLTGGTTAISATYRFRAEAAAPKMRLIGLDATTYSRTYAHDGAEMSWNLLTGDIVTARLKVAAGDSGRGYDKVGAKRARRPAAILYMEDTPDAEEELGLVMQGK